MKKTKKNKIIQEKQKMSTQFAWLTTALIAIISLLISISVMNFFSSIIKNVQEQVKTQDMYISSQIYETIVKNNNITDKKLNNKFEILIKKGIIGYIKISEKDTDKVVTYITDKEKNAETKYQKYAPTYIYKNYYIEVGFYEKTIIKDYIYEFLNKISLLTTACIFFGLLMSYFMFNIVNEPLEELLKAAESFKKGDFSSHLNKSDFEEINTLVETYNSMAESLNELYTSLEMKVEERTAQLEQAYKELQNTQSMMVHSEKMRSLGTLVAGITHEINNPINFIYGNLIHLKGYTENMTDSIDLLMEYAEKNNEALAKEVKEEYDIDFIKDDLPLLIKSCQDGAERTKNIIADLKNFSRMSDSVTSSISLPNEIDTTLNILHNKIKNRITIHKDYSENIPNIDALGGQLNQVFMNILDNACYAIKENGNIKIIMRNNEKYVTIIIEDDGCGMDKETAEKVFEPFYTTKPVGEGTGLGMSISYKVIKNHNGTIEIESEKGKGTKFTITLPIKNENTMIGE